MILNVRGTIYRGADVYVVFRDFWWAAKGTDAYSDQRGEFIAMTMRTLVTDHYVTGAAPDRTEDLAQAVEGFMRRDISDGLETPAHVLARARCSART